MSVEPSMNRDVKSSEDSLDTRPPPAPEELRSFRVPRWALGGLVGLAVIVLGIWFAATLTQERATKIFDLLVAGIVIGLLSCGFRYLLRAEALRRSRLVAAELIGVTFGGAALATLLVTMSSQAVGAGRIPALVAIQLLAAVLGGGAVFLLAFFVTLAVKGWAKLFRSQRPEAEALFIGVVTGVVGGTLTAEMAGLGAWFPFVAAAACAAASHRAVILHRRYDRE